MTARITDHAAWAARGRWREAYEASRADLPADIMVDPRVVALVEAAHKAKAVLALLEPHPLPVLGRLLRALAAMETPQ